MIAVRAGFDFVLRSFSEGVTCYSKRLFLKAIPDPDFKYFSKLYALYLSLKAQ